MKPCENCGREVAIPFISYKGMVCLRCIELIEQAKAIHELLVENRLNGRELPLHAAIVATSNHQRSKQEAAA
jgi:hypothetical protein